MEIEEANNTYDQLQKYYKYLYPSNLLCNWFGYFKDQAASNILLSRRQFSMTIQVGTEEIYKRFLSFKSAKEFQNALIHDVPIKMDIGAIYEQIPRKGAVNTPQQKEFILDIDIDSYDNVRTCCQGAKICNKCWRLMKVAAKILYRTMEEDFGYKDLLFVFSGRRGMHLWVCDERARNMTDSIRRSVMEYLYLVTGNQQSASQLSDNVLTQKSIAIFKAKTRAELKRLAYKREMHPFVAKSLQIIEGDFKKLLEEQGMFEKQERKKIVQKILARRSDKLLQNVQARWTKCRNSVQMYEAIQQQLESYERYTNQYKQKKQIPPLYKEDIFQTISFVQEEIMLTFMYPRLDINVSTARNHLLKCPFSVHPKTKKISVPFDYESVDRFDPLNCIRLPDLISEAQTLLQEGKQKYQTPESLSRVIKGMSDAILTLQKFVKNTLQRLKRQEPNLEF